METPTSKGMIPDICRVTKVVRETHDTFTLELEMQTGPGKFAFQPGQFNMVYIYGVGEIPISISGNPSESGLIVHTTRIVGTVTKAMGKLCEGDLLGIRGPFGKSWPVENATGKDVIIVTGGIGLAPLRPAIYHIIGNREKYGRLVILYGARTPNDILYKNELSFWKKNKLADIFITVDRSDSRWKGNVGLVTTLVKKAPIEAENTIAMICGPEIMMRYTVMELEKRSIKKDNVYISMERNMKCGIGFCGHCQFGAEFVCKDGPVFRYPDLEKKLYLSEI